MSRMVARHAVPTRALLAAVLTSALLAACGTTVPLTSQVSGATGGGSGLGTATTGGPGLGVTGSTGSTSSTGTTSGGPLTTGSTTGGPVQGGAPVGATTGAPAGSTATSGGSGAPQAPGGSVAGNVPGVTAKEVKIGVERIDTAALGAFASAAGTNAAIGDLNGYQDALIRWVNTSGGLAGRRLTPVFFEADISASNGQNDTARCTRWTQDSRVFAAQAAVYQGGGAVPCLAKNGVVSVATLETAPGSADDFTKYSPYYYAPATMETVSLARSYITGLQAASFFTPSSKIGLLYFDFPEYRVAKERGLKPALARSGLKVDSEYAISYGGNSAELGRITAAVQNAELRFASAGVTEVLFLDAGGTLALFFMQNAQNQRQSFRYGLNSTTDPAFLEGQSVSSELARATVAGTLPGRDTQDMASAPRNADRDRCLAILKAAGYTITSSVDRKAVFGYCSFYFFLKAAFDRASSFDPRGFAKAVADLGRSPGTAAASNGDDFSLGHPWGAARYAIATWRTDCSCFKYDGRARAF